MPRYRVLRGLNYEPKAADGTITSKFRWEVGDVIAIVPAGMDIARLISQGDVEQI